MMNYVTMVGRLVSDPTVKENEDGSKVANLTLAVQRPYKNADGEYDTDFIDCTLWNGIAQNTSNYCKKGDVIGVKGMIQTKVYEKDGEKRKSTEVVAERITFLSSSKEHSKDKEDLEV